MMLCYTLSLLILLAAQWTDQAYFDQIVDDQEEFVHTLYSVGQVTENRVIEAMQKVSRMNYTHRTLYEHYPMKAPSAYFDPANMQSFALTNLSNYLLQGNRVLDIASGSGYLAACMAYMVNDTGLVVAQFSTQEEVNIAKKNIKKNNPELINEDRIKLVVGDYKLGAPKYGPYNAIHAGIIFKQIPQTLLQQLKPKGRLMIPIDNSTHFNIFLCDKDEGNKITKTVNISLSYQFGQNISIVN